MIADACLSSVVYVPPSATVPFTDTNSSNTASLSPTPTSVALITLQTLSHLSFVISQFGGVTSQGQGFGELKKTFYLAVDVLVQERDGVRDDAEQGEGERFVKELVGDLTAGEGNGAVPKLFQEAKKAYAFASIEQLVPVLGEACIWGDVVPLCIPWVSCRRCFHPKRHAHFTDCLLADTSQTQPIARHTSPRIVSFSLCLPPMRNDMHCSNSNISVPTP